VELDASAPSASAVAGSAKVASQVQYGPCFVTQQGSAQRFIQTLSFKPGMRDEWVQELLGGGEVTSSSSSSPSSAPNPHLFVDEAGVKFEVGTGRNGQEVPSLNQMKNGKWIGYALRALIMRFWDLAKVCLVAIIDEWS